VGDHKNIIEIAGLGLKKFPNGNRAVSKWKSAPAQTG
jgi:hypothetical protein